MQEEWHITKSLLRNSQWNNGSRQQTMVAKIPRWKVREDLSNGWVGLSPASLTNQSLEVEQLGTVRLPISCNTQHYLWIILKQN